MSNRRRSSSSRSRLRSALVTGPLEHREVEHRLGPRQAREVPLGHAGHDHRVELAPDRAVGGQAPAPRRRGRVPTPSTRARARPASSDSRKACDACVGARLVGLGHDVGEGDDGVELAAGLGALAGAIDESPRARKVLPEVPERVLHAHAREQRGARERVTRGHDGLGLGGGEALGHVERVRDRAGARPRGAQQAAGRGRREPDDVGDEQLFDQHLASRLVGHEPPQREHVRPGRRLGGEREPALGHRARDARVVERPQQAAEVRALAPHDDRHVVPRRRRARRADAAARARPRRAPRSAWGATQASTTTGSGAR